MTAVQQSSSVSAYVALGSNLGGPQAQVQAAITELAALPATSLVAASALYRTAPVGPPGQPDYINAVVRLDTRLPPRALLEELQAIERRHGRQRDGTRWGPRTLDLDIIVYGDQQVDEPGLIIPHPELPRRAFVLVPLADVASREMLVPAMGTLAELLSRCSPEGVTRLSQE